MIGYDPSLPKHAAQTQTEKQNTEREGLTAHTLGNIQSWNLETSNLVRCPDVLLDVVGSDRGDMRVMVMGADPGPGH